MIAKTDELQRPSWQDALPSASDFLKWWGRELAAMLPDQLCRLFSPDHQLITIDLGNGEARWYLSAADQADQGDVMGSLPLSEGEEAVRQHLEVMLESRPRGQRALALALPQALTRIVTLPLAAGRNLASVLNLDMDRQTPFPGTAVRFIHHRLPSDPAIDGIKVALTFAPLDACERAERLASALGIELAYLGAGTIPSQRDNLMQTSGGWRRWAIFGLLALVLFLGLAAAWLPLEKDRRMAAAAQADVTALKARHDALKVEQAALAGLVAAAAATANDTARALPILADIAETLPEDSRIDRLAWRGDEVVVSGRTPAAAELVAALSAVPAFRSISYRSPVTRASSGERFHLAFEIGERGEDK